MNSEKLSQRGIGDLQRSLERFENYNDGFILPDTFLVVRLDAHRMGDWDLPDEYPCGPTVTKAMHETGRMLMASVFRVLVAYVHGDEISLLIDPTESVNPMRRSKLVSTVASAAAAHFMKASGRQALFEARLSELPTQERVLEYFFWQRRYCFRNALAIALRTALVSSGLSEKDAEKQIHGVSEQARVAKLNEVGGGILSIPHTTRRGALFCWETLIRDGREHFRLASQTALPDDDEKFVQLMSRILSESIGISQGETGTSVAPASPPPVQKQPPANSDPAPEQPKQRPFRGNKKSNVSVIKMASK